MFREDEIRERTEKYDRVYRLTGGRESPWHVEDARYLLDRVAELEAEKAHVLSLMKMKVESYAARGADGENPHRTFEQAALCAMKWATDLVERGGR